MSEHSEQVALFEWAAWVEPKAPAVKWLYAVPNGGLRKKGVAGQLKAEGVKSGYPDTGLDVASGGYHGLRIEMKIKGGRLSPAQIEWREWLISQGYKHAVCYDWQAAARVIADYLGLEHQECGL